MGLGGSRGRDRRRLPYTRRRDGHARFNCYGFRRDRGHAMYTGRDAKGFRTWHRASARCRGGTSPPGKAVPPAGIPVFLPHPSRSPPARPSTGVPRGESTRRTNQSFRGRSSVGRAPPPMKWSKSTVLRRPKKHGICRVFSTLNASASTGNQAFAGTAHGGYFALWSTGSEEPEMTAVPHIKTGVPTIRLHKASGPLGVPPSVKAQHQAEPWSILRHEDRACF